VVKLPFSGVLRLRSAALRPRFAQDDG